MSSLPTPMLAPVILRYCGFCLCSPHCARNVTGRARGGSGAWPASRDRDRAAHGAAYRLYSQLCSALAATLTLFALITLCFECADFQELTDAFINFCSLYTTWVYIRVWRQRGADLHAMLANHQRFLGRYQLQCRADPQLRRLLETMFRLDRLFTLGLVGTLLLLIALVVLQGCVTLVPPLVPVPRLLYPRPPDEGEADPLGRGGRLWRFALIMAFQCPALLCCGVPFALLSGIHFALNAHAIILLRCLKRSLELTRDLEHGRLPAPWAGRGPVDALVQQHQHILDLIRTNNDIFAKPMMERLIITYALLGLTAYCLSKDPFADVKVPLIAVFMIASLLQIAVLSDVLKDECGSLQEVLWRCDWTEAARPTHRKMVLLTARSQRFVRDGVAAAGMQDKISMLTFVQVMRSSVSFLQALRQLN